jgi:hypothetical protein
LIYGNPIPHYDAPSEVITPAARSMSMTFREVLTAVGDAGYLNIAPGLHKIPPTVLDHYEGEFGITGEMAPVFQTMNTVWSTMHGMTSLEIYNHLAPVVGDTDAFFAQAMRHSLRSAGVMID